MRHTRKSIYPRDLHSFVPTSVHRDTHLSRHMRKFVHPKDNRSLAPTSVYPDGHHMRHTCKFVHSRDSHSFWLISGLPNLQIWPLCCISFLGQYRTWLFVYYIDIPLNTLHFVSIFGYKRILTGSSHFHDQLQNIVVYSTSKNIAH